MRELFRISVTVMLTLLGLVIIWYFSGIIALYIIALFVSVTVRPAVDWLRKLRIPVAGAMLLVYLVILALFVGAAILAFPVLSREVQQFLANFNLAYRSLYEQLTANSEMAGSVQRSLPPPATFPTILPGIGRQELTNFLAGTTIGVVEAVSQLLLIAFLGLYLAIDNIRFERMILSVVSPLQRTSVRQIYHEIEDSLGAYIRSEITQSTLVALILFGAYLAIGLRYPLLSALIVAVCWAIPLVGGVLGLAWVALAGFMTQGPVIFVALAVTAVVFVFLEFWLKPRLYRQDRFGIILVLVTMIILARTFGFIGLLIAPPLATAIQIIINALLRVPGSTGNAIAEAQERPTEQVVTDEWQELEHRLGDLRMAIEGNEEISQSTNSLFQRLVGLVEKSKAELASDKVGIRES